MGLGGESMLEDKWLRHVVTRITDPSAIDRFDELGVTTMNAAMDQAVLLDANVHKGAKVDDVAHGALQDHSLAQVLHFEHVAAQDRRGQLVARVAARLEQGLQDVAQICLLRRHTFGDDVSSHGRNTPGVGTVERHAAVEPRGPPALNDGGAGGQSR